MSKDKRKYADRATYLKQAVKKRRKQLRLKAIEYKGGKCIFCGYNKYKGTLEFHHIDESSKEFGLSEKGITRSWPKIQKELDKCVLVCANCHRELHGKLLQLPTVMLVGNGVNCGKPNIQMDQGNPQPILSGLLVRQAGSETRK